MSTESLDIKAIRARLEAKGGPQYWRSLESVAETPEFQEFLHREFPSSASEWTDPVGRRSFLKLMGASIALAGATACTRQPDELIVPFVRQPEEMIPGRPLFFATAMSLGGVATGLLVESHEGRPTKIEGNPDHPGSLGATDLFAQASVLTLYDPDRSQSVLQLGEIRPWSAFLTSVKSALSGQTPSKGAGLRILTETVDSPTMAAQIREILGQFPEARWIQWDPMSRGQARAGARIAFGEAVEPLYDLTKADLIVSLDADFLSSDGPFNLRYSRQFASRRRMESTETTPSRLYVVEPTHTVTGGRADHRLPLGASRVDSFARALAARVGVAGVSGQPPAGAEAFLEALAKDLLAHRGRSAVMVGDGQPAAVHAVAHAINQALGNAGETVVYLPTPEAAPSDQLEDMRTLVTDMNAGRVQMLMIIGESNPVFSAPADLNFADALAKVPMRAHSGLFLDETAVLCHWHVPAAHYLEAWSDARTVDGTVSIVQPLIQPLYGGRSAHEVLASMTERPDRNGYDVVREYWQAQNLPGATPGAGFENAWRKWLHDGVIEGTAYAPKTVSLAADWLSRAPAVAATTGMEINFRRDPMLYDGRFANNGWLQEAPRPMTKLTWDNAAHIAPATAEALGVDNGDILEVRHDGRLLRLPAWISPGDAPDSLTITVGYGRTRAGRVGNGTGFNAFVLRGSTSPYFGAADVRATGDRYALVSTQDHWTLEGRNVVRSAHLEQFRANPEFAKEMEHITIDRGITLMPHREFTGYQWGMAIDMNACTGCTACVVACVAENNIPVVGKEQVERNREMHWLRVDRYYVGGVDNPDTYFQPMPCQQCENAPCEVVCPVAATTPSAEGLNDMVYNRCVGTRYCSNNCPYKVRRFNFLLYSDWTTPTLKMARNPDVTVRSRGVMEKCTYCVQRINHARIQAKLEDRVIKDGEVQTACQTACPSQAITFGNINDPEAAVAKLKKEPREYGILEDLNTRPRTTYLAVVRNPNPEITPEAATPAHGGSHETSPAPAAAGH